MGLQKLNKKWLALAFGFTAMLLFIAPASAETAKYQSIVYGEKIPGYSFGASKSAALKGALKMCKEQNGKQARSCEKRYSSTVDIGQYLISLFCTATLNGKRLFLTQSGTSGVSFSDAVKNGESQIYVGFPYKCVTSLKLHNGKKY